MILPRTLKQTNESGDNCLLRRCYCSELLEAFAPLGVTFCDLQGTNI